RRQRREQGVHRVAAEQDDADQPVGPREEPFGEPRAAPARRRQMTEPMPVQAHHGDFRRGKERGEADEKYQRADEGAQRNTTQAGRISGLSRSILAPAREPSNLGKAKPGKQLSGAGLSRGRTW